MIDDLLGLAIATAIDVEAAKAAKKHRWVRIVQVLVALLFLSAVVAGIFVTVWYS